MLNRFQRQRRKEDPKKLQRALVQELRDRENCALFKDYREAYRLAYGVSIGDLDTLDYSNGWYYVRGRALRKEEFRKEIDRLYAKAHENELTANLADP